MLSFARKCLKWYENSSLMTYNYRLKYEGFASNKGNGLKNTK